jgi:hypothetical protein
MKNQKFTEVIPKDLLIKSKLPITFHKLEEVKIDISENNFVNAQNFAISSTYQTRNFTCSHFYKPISKPL